MNDRFDLARGCDHFWLEDPLPVPSEPIPPAKKARPRQAPLVNRSGDPSTNVYGPLHWRVTVGEALRAVKRRT